MAGPTERAWYSVAEVAQLLGVSRTTVWRWIRAGQLPARRVGPRMLRVERSAVAGLADPELATERSVVAEHPSRRFSETGPVYTATSENDRPASAGGVWSADEAEFAGEDVPPAPLFNDYDPDRVRASLRAHGGSWAELDTDAIIADLYRARETGTRRDNGR